MYVGGGFGRDAKESLEEFCFRARELEIAAEQRAPRCTRTVAFNRGSANTLVKVEAGGGD